MNMTIAAHYLTVRDSDPVGWILNGSSPGQIANTVDDCDKRWNETMQIRWGGGGGGNGPLAICEILQVFSHNARHSAVSSSSLRHCANIASPLFPSLFIHPSSPATKQDSPDLPRPGGGRMWRFGRAAEKTVNSNHKVPSTVAVPGRKIVNLVHETSFADEIDDKNEERGEEIEKFKHRLEEKMKDML
uniref:Uncharacterized protein n=1 Tax=Timema cristinae TaxID=61476 RepID=A0A7R9CS90_TIMCR|nr:unnamed protein product [Timema cristinae]